MKYLFAAAASLAVLTACNGAPPDEQILTGACTDLFSGDPRSEGMISGDAGTDVASFCACFAAQSMTDPATTALHKDILVSMTEIQKADGLNVEDTADRIESAIEDGTIDTFTEAQFDELGDYFQDLAATMQENGGSCPIA